MQAYHHVLKLPKMRPCTRHILLRVTFENIMLDHPTSRLHQLVHIDHHLVPLHRLLLLVHLAHRLILEMFCPHLHPRPSILYHLLDHLLRQTIPSLQITGYLLKINQQAQLRPLAQLMIMRRHGPLLFRNYMTNFLQMNGCTSAKAYGTDFRQVLVFLSVSITSFTMGILFSNGIIGNLPSEQVTKRDLFYAFYRYGRLAQVSIKQA
jgi:hypothetical protein